MNGDNETGVTICKISKNLFDAGPIIRQGRYWIKEYDNYLSVAMELSLMGGKLLDEILM